MANNTIYPYGTNGELPSSIGIINDLITGGADKALSAEQGKVIGSDLYTHNEYSVFNTINQSSITSCGGTIKTSATPNTWLSSNNYTSGLVSVNNTSKVKIYVDPNGVGGVNYTFVTAGPTWDSSVQYATGYSTFVWSNTDVIVDVPLNAVYLVVMIKSGQNYYVPLKVELLETVEVIGIKDKVDEMEDKVVTIYNEYSTFISCGGTIKDADNTWLQSSDYYGSTIDVEQYRGKTVKITRNANGHGITYAFLTAGPSWGNLASFATGYSSVVKTFEKYVMVEIPSDAVYLYVYLMSRGTDYTPTSVIVYNTNSLGYENLLLQEANAKQDHLFKVMAPKKIRIATYNIGHFSGGVQKNSTITSADYVAKLAAYRQVVDAIDADVFGISEYSEIFGKNTSNVDVKTSEVLLNDFIPYEGNQYNYSCNALFYKTAIFNVDSKIFDCNQTAVITHTNLIKATDYYYLESDLYMRGHLIKLVSTHLAFDNNNNQVCADQISELITKFSNYDKVVMIGDWNVATFDMFNPFIAAGYSMANDGTYYTFPSANRALDNIIVKGVTISDVGMVTTSNLSDHYPLYCDIEI